MMSDAGFTNVRIAEFAWGLMEPAEGKFEFAWLRARCKPAQAQHCGHSRNAVRRRLLRG